MATHYRPEAWQDTLVAWVAAHAGPSLSHAEGQLFLRGIFFIVEDAIRHALLRERRRFFREVQRQVWSSQ